MSEKLSDTISSSYSLFMLVVHGGCVCMFSSRWVQGVSTPWEHWAAVATMSVTLWQHDLSLQAEHVATMWGEGCGSNIVTNNLCFGGDTSLISLCMYGWISLT